MLCGEKAAHRIAEPVLWGAGKCAVSAVFGAAQHDFFGRGFGERCGGDKRVVLCVDANQGRFHAEQRIFGGTGLPVFFGGGESVYGGGIGPVEIADGADFLEFFPAQRRMPRGFFADFFAQEFNKMPSVDEVRRSFGEPFCGGGQIERGADGGGGDNGGVAVRIQTFDECVAAERDADGEDFFAFEGGAEEFEHP